MAPFLVSFARNLDGLDVEIERARDVQSSRHCATACAGGEAVRSASSFPTGYKTRHRCRRTRCPGRWRHRCLKRRHRAGARGLAFKSQIAAVREPSGTTTPFWSVCPKPAPPWHRGRSRRSSQTECGLCIGLVAARDSAIGASGTVFTLVAALATVESIRRKLDAGAAAGDPVPAQLSLQLPELQTSGLAQELPQAPQLFGSVLALRPRRCTQKAAATLALLGAAASQT